MTATRIDDKLTPLPVDGLLRALNGGYLRVMGQRAGTAECLACLGAQLCLESGNGAKCHGWNFGNRKMPSDWDGLYAGFRCDEIFDGPTTSRAKSLGPCIVSQWKGGPLFRVVLPAEHPWSRFCAFASAEEGAADYVAFLATRDRYRAAWSRAFRGDPTGFSYALRAAGYFTADVDQYAKGLVSIFSRILPACQAIVAGDGAVVSEEDAANILALSAELLTEGLWSHDRHEELIA